MSHNQQKSPSYTAEISFPDDKGKLIGKFVDNKTFDPEAKFGKVVLLDRHFQIDAPKDMLKNPVAIEFNLKFHEKFCIAKPFKVYLLNEANNTFSIPAKIKYDIYKKQGV